MIFNMQEKEISLNFLEILSNFSKPGSELQSSLKLGWTLVFVLNKRPLYFHNTSGGSYGLRSKRFRGISEQKQSEEQDFKVLAVPKMGREQFVT